MGGYAGGEIASALAAESVDRFVSRAHLRGDNVVWPAHRLNLSRIAGRESRFDRDFGSPTRPSPLRRVGELDKMGSTLSLLLGGAQERLFSATFGDSRIYRLRDDRLTCLTTPITRSTLSSLLKDTIYRPRSEYPYANVITDTHRALGACGKSDVGDDRGTSQRSLSCCALMD